MLATLPNSLPADVRDRIMAGALAEARRRVAARAQGPRYRFYGANLAFYHYRGPEFMISGPTGTGKTIAALALLDTLARDIPGSQWAIVRKVRADMDGTVLQTFKDKVLGPDTDVAIYGGEKAEWYDYPNGSRIWVGGMDKPGKVLSAERDGIYYNQAEQGTLKEWETLLTRTTGRAGHLKTADGKPLGLLFGDCNPDGPAHWIWARQLGGLLKFFESRHRDNPELYDQATGQITERGRVELAQLDRLTGYRKLRYRDGLWAQAEGIIFDTWSDADNVTEAAEYVPDGGNVFWALDDGYSAGSAHDTRGLDPNTGQYVADAHPRAFLLCQERPDGSLNVFYENYACLKLSDQHIAEVQAEPYPAPQYAVHGPGQAEIRGRLYSAGVPPRQSVAKVEESIKEMHAWLAADANGWRRVKVHPRCVRLRSEMVSYAYEPETGKPVKAFDHGPDALRGLLWTLRFNR